MRNAIILVMSCNKDRFLNEEKIIKKTWGKDILEGKYENLKLIFYRGGAKESYYDEENNIYHSKENDNLDGTYQKTLDVFKYVEENFKYDYIIRTNTATYINIDAIIQFLNLETYYDNKIIGPDLIINHINFSTPFLRGHFMIIPPKFIKILINNEVYINGIDDIIMGYFLGKVFKEKYTKILLSVDGINLNNSYIDKLSQAYCIKIKDEDNEEKNILYMLGLHTLYKGKLFETKINPPGNFKTIETEFGIINLEN